MEAGDLDSRQNATYYQRGRHEVLSGSSGEVGRTSDDDRRGNLEVLVLTLRVLKFHRTPTIPANIDKAVRMLTLSSSSRD